MKAIRVHAYGGPEQLRLEEASQPKVEGGKVLVRIHVASVNPIDFKLASGNMRQIMPIKFPWIPGGDFSGIVEEVGSGVSGLAKGDAVYGDASGGGAYAEFYAGPASMIAPKPRRLSDIEAASVPLAAQTAWQGLFDHGRLERGETVLIHAASGGVGTFAVQLAHWKGAKVLATASADNVDYVRSLGADHGHRLQGHSLRVSRQKRRPRARSDRRRNPAAFVRRPQSRRPPGRHRASPRLPKRPRNTRSKPR